MIIIYQRISVHIPRPTVAKPFFWAWIPPLDYGVVVRRRETLVSTDVIPVAIKNLAARRPKPPVHESWRNTPKTPAKSPNTEYQYPKISYNTPYSINLRIMRRSVVVITNARH